MEQICFGIHCCVCLSIVAYIRPSGSLCVYLAVVYMNVCMHIFPIGCLFVRSFVCLLFVCVFVCLFVNL